MTISEIDAVECEIDIAAEPEVVYALRLVHRGLRLSQARDEHRAGWLLYLDRLRTATTGQDAGPDPNANPAAPLGATYAHVVWSEDMVVQGMFRQGANADAGSGVGQLSRLESPPKPTRGSPA